MFKTKPAHYNAHDAFGKASDQVLVKVELQNSVPKNMGDVIVCYGDSHEKEEIKYRPGRFHTPYRETFFESLAVKMTDIPSAEPIRVFVADKTTGKEAELCSIPFPNEETLTSTLKDPDSDKKAADDEHSLPWRVYEIPLGNNGRSLKIGVRKSNLKEAAIVYVSHVPDKTQNKNESQLTR